MSINRYDPQGTMYADPDGEWVSIIDHFKALAAVREEGRREGIEEAAREVYNFILREKKEDMTPSEVRQKYETETGKRWYVYHPSDFEKHNATIPYASWDYQLWLEKKVDFVESPLGWIKLYEQKDAP